MTLCVVLGARVSLPNKACEGISLRFTVFAAAAAVCAPKPGRDGLLRLAQAWWTRGPWVSVRRNPG